MHGPHPTRVRAESVTAQRAAGVVGTARSEIVGQQTKGAMTGKGRDRTEVATV